MATFYFDGYLKQLRKKIYSPYKCYSMRNAILVLIIAGFSWFVFSSYKSGLALSYGMNLTGAGGSTNNCAGSSCHDPNTSELNLAIYLTDPLNNDDTVKNGKYFPNGFYKVKLYGFLTSFAVTYPWFGFQFTSQRANGLFGGYYQGGSGLQSNPAGGFEIVEQSPNPLPSHGNNHFAKEFYWKAPEPGAGNVTLFVTMLAANGDGVVTGDKTNNEQRTFAENPLSVGSFDEPINMNIYPNPVKDQLMFSMDKAEPGDYSFILYSYTGQFMERKNHAVSTGKFNTSFITSSFPAGNYFLQISKGEKRKVIPFVKE